MVAGLCLVVFGTVCFLRAYDGRWLVIWRLWMGSLGCFGFSGLLGFVV